LRLDYRDGEDIRGIGVNTGLRYEFDPVDVPNVPRGSIYKAPSVADAYNWTGFYIGGILGAAWGDTTWSSQPLGCESPFFSCPGSASPGLAGMTFGGEIGYNYQFGHWVTGLEGDFAWSNANGSRSCIVVPGFTCSNDHLNQLATATGRLGYSWDRILVYGKGGVAAAQDSYSVSQTQAIPHVMPPGPPTNFNEVIATAGDTRVGWTLGAGLEFGFSRNWSAKLEYDFVDLGTKGFFSFSDKILPIQIKETANRVIVGVIYRFGDASP